MVYIPDIAEIFFDVPKQIRPDRILFPPEIDKHTSSCTYTPVSIIRIEYSPGLFIVIAALRVGNLQNRQTGPIYEGVGNPLRTSSSHGSKYLV